MTEPSIPQEMKIGKIKFERGDAMLISYQRARLTCGTLSKLREDLHKSFPGVRIVFIPEGIKIDCLRFRDVSVTVNIEEKVKL